MRTPNNRHYKRNRVSSGDMNMPVRFLRKTDNGYLPGSDTVEQLYFCEAEMYESSVKDIEKVNMTNAQFVMTLIFPDPYTDYIPEFNHYFYVEDVKYQDVEFNIQTISPYDENKIKVVGVAYGD